MQAQRNTAFIFLLILSFAILYFWSGDKTKEEIAKNQPITTITTSKSTKDTETNYVTVSTDLYNLKINLAHGEIFEADLKDQKQSVGSDENFHLLKDTNNYHYIANSDLFIDGKTFEKPFTTSQKEYQLNGDSLQVKLESQTDDGLKIEKIYTFTKGKHVIDLSYKIANTDNEKKIKIFSYLDQTALDPEQSAGMFGTSAYRGIAYSTDTTKYSKLSIDDIAESAKMQTEFSKNGGWVSMIQHYFVTSWIGSSSDSNTLVFKSSDNGLAAIAGIQSTEYSLKTNEELQISNRLWVGPKIQEEMEATVANLHLTVDYGWLSFISIFLFKIMLWIHSVLLFLGIENAMGAWGFTIILLTLLVRGIMYPLTKHQYVSMAKMRLLAPKLQVIKERFKDDRQRLTQEMMALYQREKVKPLSGCLPILIQMPIFIALYWTFMESIELRHSPFILWIEDLSSQDPYFVLPILMGITMLLIQKMSPTPITDPMQKKIMMLMPIIFTLMFCTFPAGLTLYWVISNCVTVIQQYFIFKALEKRGLNVKNTSK